MRLAHLYLFRSRSGDAQATSVVSKGVSAKGTNFRTGGFTNLKNFDGDNNHHKFQSFMPVIATQDNTNISFSNIDAAVVLNQLLTITT